MGIDWQTQCAPTWQRSWDRGREELSKPNLFTHEPEVKRTFRVTPLREHDFIIDQQHQLRLDGDVIIVLEGVRSIGESVSASSIIVKKIRESGCGIALGVVRDVYPFTHHAEIAVL